MLFYLEGKSAEDVATALGRPRGTVLSQLARAREQLRIRLSRRNGEKSRDRSKEIRRNRFHNRHQRALTRETRKLPVIGMDHLSTWKLKIAPDEFRSL